MFTRNLAAAALCTFALMMLAACGQKSAEPPKAAAPVEDAAKAKAAAEAAAKEKQALETAAKEKQALEAAIDAYVYGYPLVTMEHTRRVSTNVEKPVGSKAPMGQFAKLRHTRTPRSRRSPRPTPTRCTRSSGWT